MQGDKRESDTVVDRDHAILERSRSNSRGPNATPLSAIAILHASCAARTSSCAPHTCDCSSVARVISRSSQPRMCVHNSQVAVRPLLCTVNIDPRRIGSPFHAWRWSTSSGMAVMMRPFPDSRKRPTAGPRYPNRTWSSEGCASIAPGPRWSGSSSPSRRAPVPDIAPATVDQSRPKRRNMTHLIPVSPEL